VLEDGERARARGANILARLAGYGASSDAYHLTAPEKDGGGAIEAMKAALADAGYGPQDIVYVNAHGTSTPLNDRAETIAIKKVLGDQVPVSSLKSSIGHLLGAAGAVEAVATILAMRDRVAPPTLNYETPDEGLDLDYVPNEARTLDINGKPAVALSNAFGFGGHNAVLCLEVA
jgi:3-oxoacyl-[acyl-carrier-protein] synthase II